MWLKKIFDSLVFGRDGSRFLFLLWGVNVFRLDGNRWETIYVAVGLVCFGGSLKLCKK